MLANTTDDLDPDSLYQVAAKAEERGDLPGAIEIYHRILGENPKDLRAREGLAASLLRTGDLSSAAAAYAELTTIAPDQSAGWIGRAEMLRRAGRPKEALVAFDEAVKRFPHDAAARRGRDELLRELAPRETPTPPVQQSFSAVREAPGESVNDDAPPGPDLSRPAPVEKTPDDEPPAGSTAQPDSTSPKPGGAPAENRQFLDDARFASDGTATDPKLGFLNIAEKMVALVTELANSGSKTQPKPSGVPAEGAEDAQTGQAVEEPMVAIGIFGPWGAGKSTLLKALKRRFERPDQNYPCILINSWKWDGKGDVHDFIRSEIRKYCRREMWSRKRALWPTITGNVRILLRRYGQIGLFALLVLTVAIIVWMKAPPTTADAKDVAVTTGVGVSFIAIVTAAWNLVSPKLWDIAKNLLPRLLSEAGPAGLAIAYRDILDLGSDRPFVVFIDDLDRCSAERVVSFVECINNLTAIGCVTFLFCDDEFVAAAINSRYKGIIEYHRDKNEFGRRFLEKIVQIPFRIPAVDEAGILELGLSAEAGPQVPPPDRIVVDRPDSQPSEVDPPKQLPGETSSDKSVPTIKLRQIIGELLQEVVQPLGLNIRQVKTLSNTLKLYLDIAAFKTESDARRLAAFVFADRVDPDWLDAHYRGEERKDSALGQLPTLPAALRKMIGSDQKAMLGLYRMIGRRPSLARTSVQPAPAAPVPAG